MNNGKERIYAQLKLKEKRLQALYSAWEFSDLSEEKALATKADEFLNEISSVSKFLDNAPEMELFELATLVSMDKLTEKADFSSMEFDGEYCKILLVQIHPYPDLRLVYIAPIESL